MRLVLIAALAAILAPGHASAQSWQVYSYPDQGFAFQLPTAPKIEDGVAAAPTGGAAPVKTYSAKAAGIDYTLSIFDLSKSAAQERDAIAQAESALGKTGAVAVSVDARINRQFGRELTIDAKDGSRLTVALFFMNQHLFQLVARAAPPDPTDRSADALHFQQSLQFIADNQGPGDRGGGPGGGRFRGQGGRGGFNPQGVTACLGKAAGDRVQLDTPDGQVAATCTLVARPDRPPDGGVLSNGPPPPR